MRILTVTNVPPAITRQPTNQAVVVGTNVTLAVTATGTAPLHYQWQVNGTNLVDGGALEAVKPNQGSTISGATTSKLTIRNAQTNNSGNYTVIVTNFWWSVTSSVASLTVATSPVILTQPTNQAVASGIDRDLCCHRRRDNAVELPMAGGRDESGEWDKRGWKPDQWRNHHQPDHQQRADEQQRQLHGHRHELCRIGDQFHTPS